jgi:hypothetical protein
MTRKKPAAPSIPKPAEKLDPAAWRAAAKRHPAGTPTTIREKRWRVETCRRLKARLVISKLDRLSRNLAFIAALMESGVEFVAVDNPHATKLPVHILAAVAEHEREMISADRDGPRRREGARQAPWQSESREGRRHRPSAPAGRR